jgi:microcystin-dependent protein
MVGFNFAPEGWAMCNGQTMSIAQNTALFSLLGTTYGGNGTTTFNLPNLQGRVPIHMGTSTLGSTWVWGQIAGVENVTLLQSNMPIHNHQVTCVTSGGNQASPANGFPAIESTGTSLNYSNGPSNGTMAPTTLTTVGGSIPFSILNPYLVVNFVIALQGIFPSRN